MTSSQSTRYTLETTDAGLAVARLGPGDPVPDWAQGDFVAITRTRTELSVVCADSLVPDDVTVERGWTAMRVTGPLPFDHVGVITSITAPLHAAHVPVFVISTYDTDYVLIKSDQLEDASAALAAYGHTIVKR